MDFHIHSQPIGANHNCTAGGAHFSPYNKSNCFEYNDDCNILSIIIDTSHGIPRDPVMQRHVGDINGGGHTGKGKSNTIRNADPRIACGTILLI
ncbi:unnamed protein product [Adineta steineri]|uniref:Superoxide dismutase n=1 Tax=Adineta steineri TaxID=433720 RepID=A0A814PZR5_9BILA|nr:unnamed protein product [Adineta steineri]